MLSYLKFQNPVEVNSGRQRDFDIYVFAILASIFLSFWTSMRDGLINPDGICYVQSAADIGTQGLKAAMQLCDQSKWPFYSLLIYGFAKLSHFSYELSALVIDGLFSLISVLSFILVTALLGASRRVLWLAAAVILLAHEFNNIREYIVRDHGFLAFYSLSLLCLLKYFQTPRAILALLWSALVIAAALFRIEGIIFLLLLPFMAFFYRAKAFKLRMKMFMHLNIFTLLISLVLIFGSAHWGRLDEVRSQFLSGFSILSHNFHYAAEGLAQHVISPDAANDAGTLLLLLLGSWYLFAVGAALTLPYTALLLYAWYQRSLTLDIPAKLVLCGYIAVNVLATGAFILENIFISKRYLAALTLVLMFWLPFALDKLIQKKHKICLTVFILFMLADVLSILFNFGYSKYYLHSAGDWLAQNVPQQAVLYSNDELVMYYSQHFGKDIFVKSHAFSNIETIANGQWQQYDYLALSLSGRELANNTVLPAIPSTPVKTFANKRGDEVVIYKILH